LQIIWTPVFTGVTTFYECIKKEVFMKYNKIRVGKLVLMVSIVSFLLGFSAWVRTPCSEASVYEEASPEFEVLKKKIEDLFSMPASEREKDPFYQSLLQMEEEDFEKLLELFAGDVPGMRDDERIIRMARVRRRPRVMRMMKEEYTRRIGKAPEVSQKVVFDPAIPGEVTSVTETEVIVRFSAKPGAEVDTPFGRGVIREKQDRYEIVIDANVGTLVRSGPIVGRIVGVDERLITIDYGDPFGGEALVCDVMVESVAPASGSPQEGRLAVEPR